MTRITVEWPAILLIISLVSLGIGGYVANAVKLIGALGGEITAMFVARVAGIFVVPFGSILGFF